MWSVHDSPGSRTRSASGTVSVVVFLCALITMVLNLIVDASERFLDPRAELSIWRRALAA